MNAVFNFQEPLVFIDVYGDWVDIGTLHVCGHCEFSFFLYYQERTGEVYEHDECPICECQLP